MNNNFVALVHFTYTCILYHYSENRKIYLIFRHLCSYKYGLVHSMIIVLIIDRTCKVV